MALKLMFRPVFEFYVQDEFHVFQQIVAHFLRTFGQYRKTGFLGQKLVPVAVLPIAAQTIDGDRKSGASFVFDQNIVHVLGRKRHRLRMQTAVVDQYLVAKMVKGMNERADVIVANSTDFPIRGIQGAVFDQFLFLKQFVQNVV